MALSKILLSTMRADAITRMPNRIHIYDRVIVDDGHGGEKETWPTPRSGGPFPAAIQIKERYPFTENVAQKTITSTDYIVKVPHNISIDNTCRIYDIGSENFYEVSEHVDEHESRITNLWHCKKVR